MKHHLIECKCSYFQCGFCSKVVNSQDSDHRCNGFRLYSEKIKEFQASKEDLLENRMIQITEEQIDQ